MTDTVVTSAIAIGIAATIGVMTDVTMVIGASSAGVKTSVATIIGAVTRIGDATIGVGSVGAIIVGTIAGNAARRMKPAIDTAVTIEAITILRVATIDTPGVTVNTCRVSTATIDTSFATITIIT